MTYKKSIFYKQGFTLIELLVVIAIVSVVTAFTVWGIFNSTSSSNSKNQIDLASSDFINTLNVAKSRAVNGVKILNNSTSNTCDTLVGYSVQSSRPINAQNNPVPSERANPQYYYYLFLVCKNGSYLAGIYSLKQYNAQFSGYDNKPNYVLNLQFNFNGTVDDNTQSPSRLDPSSSVTVGIETTNQTLPNTITVNGDGTIQGAP